MMKLSQSSSLLLLLYTLIHVIKGQIAVTNGPIRLWRNGSTSLSYSSGRVQVVNNHQWGNICDSDSFGITEATVICHQLGYVAASGYSKTSSDAFGTDTLPAVLSSVSCSSASFLVIHQCDYNSITPSSCTNNDDISVTCISTPRIWNNPYFTQIRLTGGATVNQGLVEVYCNGRWGTICDSSKNNADTICRQLGYERAYRYNHLTMRGVSSMPIWLRGLSCPSPRTCVKNCGLSSCPRNYFCSHSRDVTIECHSPSRYTSTTEITCDRYINVDGAMILWRNGETNPAFTSGRVQLLYSAQWGNINSCGPKNFGLTEATVVCHQLGYAGAVGYSTAGDDSFGIDTSPTVMGHVSCSTSSYLTIHQCNNIIGRIDPHPLSLAMRIPSSCSQDINDVAVTCYTNRIWDNPYPLQIRLTRGISVNQGLVEVYCNGQWGTMCRNSFRRNDAITICKQLGYNTIRLYNYYKRPVVGTSDQPIWLSNAQCGSVQPCLGNCTTCPTSQTCTHSQDVTIECTYEEYANVSTTTNSTCLNAQKKSVSPTGGPETESPSDITSRPSFFTFPTASSASRPSFFTFPTASSASRPSFFTFPTVSSAVNSTGVLVGSLLGAFVLIILIFAVLTVVVIVYRNYKTMNQSVPSRVNYTTGYPTMSSRPEYPEQPSVPFNLPQPREEPVTQTRPTDSHYAVNLPQEPVPQTQPTDSDFTEAPPPAYGLHENFTEYKETLPPSYSDEFKTNNSSQPLPAQLPPSYTDDFKA